jgi:hypothetical protein
VMRSSSACAGVTRTWQCSPRCIGGQTQVPRTHVPLRAWQSRAVRQVPPPLEMIVTIDCTGVCVRESGRERPGRGTD